ncbi:MAG: drug/metabolite transporter (DMT)-like permease [Cellvibrionaceae bacterium]|jgi:drug/metabolite transporter (DMT)-like permease
MPKSTHLRAILILLLASVLFSLGGVFIKLSTWDALPLNGARSGVSAIVIGLIIRKLREGPRPTFTPNMVLGAIAYTLTNITFIIATKLTTAANAVFLQFTAPVWVILGSFLFLAEKPKWVDWVTVGVILPGMALFFADQLSTEGVTGNLIAIISGICMSFMVILLRSESEAAGEIVVLGAIFALLIGLPFMFNQDWTWANIALILGLGIFQLGISFGFYISAIRYLTPVEIIVIMSLEPILNPVWVALFAGETPGVWAIIGGGIVVLAIVGRVLFTIRQEQKIAYVSVQG